MQDMMSVYRDQPADFGARSSGVFIARDVACFMQEMSQREARDYDLAAESTSIRVFMIGRPIALRNDWVVIDDVVGGRTIARVLANETERNPDGTLVLGNMVAEIVAATGVPTSLLEALPE